MTEREGIAAYPLYWPTGWARTEEWARRWSKFGRHSTRGSFSVYSEVQDIRRQLKLMGARAENSVISTNLKLNSNGTPSSRQAQPDDPGVAVYFDFGDRNEQHVLACDKWLRVEENLRAISRHIEAMRAQDRWGVGSLQQAFAGYRALPDGGPVRPRAWHEVLGLMSNASEAEIKEAYRKLAHERHPDKGGSRAAWDELDRAYREAIHGR